MTGRAGKVSALLQAMGAGMPSRARRDRRQRRVAAALAGASGSGACGSGGAVAAGSGAGVHLPPRACGRARALRRGPVRRGEPTRRNRAPGPRAQGLEVRKRQDSGGLLVPRGPVPPLTRHTVTAALEHWNSLHPLDSPSPAHRPGVASPAPRPAVQRGSAIVPEPESADRRA